MPILEVIVGLIVVVVVTAAVAKRIGALSPILLVLVGIGLSFVPGLPTVSLKPEVVLIGILPPLLYVAAVETSVPAFKYNLRPILFLAVGLVLATTAAVGFGLYALLGHHVPLAACFALGAVVAPPDAVAATAVARRIGLPRRIVTVLEGESLINDATALVAFRVAVAAATGQAMSSVSIAREAAVAAFGGVLVGALGAVALTYIHRRITDPLLDNAASLLTPFVVFAAAEVGLHASGVVAVVVCGLYLGHRMPTLMSAGSRLQMEAFWRMVKFLLEGAVFLLVGLQMRAVLVNLGQPAPRALLIALAVIGIVVLTRMAWMFPATYLPHFLLHRRDDAIPVGVPVILGWAGMRGAVTLAAALALPDHLAGGREYPRGLFVVLAFAVIVGTLVLQGATLPQIARWVGIPHDDEKKDALAEASVQHEASRAARDRLDAVADGAPDSVVQRLRAVAESRSNLAWERLGRAGRETPSAAYARLRREMLDAEREVFRVARDGGRIAEEVLRRAQRDMDLEESLLERRGYE